MRYIAQSGIVCWVDGGAGGGEGGAGAGDWVGAAGGGLMMKALTALQVLRLLELQALTFQ